MEPSKKSVTAASGNGLANSCTNPPPSDSKALQGLQDVVEASKHNLNAEAQQADHPSQVALGAVAVCSDWKHSDSTINSEK